MKPFYLLLLFFLPVLLQGKPAFQLLETYCLDCHDGETKKGNLDMEALLDKGKFDGILMFENLITGKMPPANKKQPTANERRSLLEWLAARQEDPGPAPFRRLTRHEFVHSVNDLLGIEYDLSSDIPEDRGTYYFDTDRRIQLGQEMLTKYFSVADRMLDFAFPEEGFLPEQTWVTNKLMDSHKTYNIYHRPYKEGTLFSWTRANNGNSYSFFWDNFDPPAPGWYELTFEAAKVGDFEEDVSIQVHAGKYYYADDRPQPQRFLDVISVGSQKVKPYTIPVFLNPWESVSTHSYSKHNFRNKNPRIGAYIKQLKVRGPLQEQWPPQPFQKVFSGLQMDAPDRDTLLHSEGFQSNLRKIGGKVRVSSFQQGMEKEKMQDGSNLTFWHTRFQPTLAKPPHFVIIENPREAEINGLSYSTWTGGNGNGLVNQYEIYFSDDGQSWGEPIMDGGLDVRLSNTQPIIFPKPTNKPFIQFLITGSKSLDSRSLASIGKLDVLTSVHEQTDRTRITLAGSPKDLKRVLRRFAETAFSSDLDDSALAPYFEVALQSLEKHDDFLQASKAGLKSILCSPRFLMAPGEHSNSSYSRASSLAKTLWLSVPDHELLQLASSDKLSGEELRQQIHRMLGEDKARRMVQSFCDQWLELRSWDKVTPSLKLYPLYDDLLNHFLPLETEAYLHHLLIENLPISNLLDADFTFLNQRLARHYGIEGIHGQELRKVSFPSKVPRGGLLTMGSILKITTDGFDTSPILRGAWISKNIVGTPLSPPPEDVPVIEPDHTEAASLKEQIEQHTTNKTCFACHKDIDPYGFALENFDASGQWREKYSVKLPHRGTFTYRPKGYFRLAGTVDASSEIGEQAFDDIEGLKTILLNGHRKVAYNFARKVFQYTNGYSPNLNQRLALFDMTKDDPEKSRMKDLVTDILVYSLKGK